MRGAGFGGLGADGTDALGLECEVRMFSGDEKEEGFDGGEALVAGACAPAFFFFIVVEEGEDLLLVDVFDEDVVGGFFRWLSRKRSRSVMAFR